MSDALSVRGYSISFEVYFTARPSVVWKALTKKINAWWPVHFYSSDKTKAFVVEPEVGGRVFEDAGKGRGAEWARIIAYQPNEKLIWTGNHFGSAGKNFGHFFLTLLLKANDTGTTLSVEDSGYGMLHETISESLESGWRELFCQHLKEYVERRG